MSLIRSDLRLALTTGLANGFSSLSPLAFGIYMPLAVLAVCTGTVGDSILQGQQRIVGSLLGMGLLILALKGLSGIAFPLAIALTLGAMRLVGSLLGLEVGYKVGGMIIIMGWLVHDQQLDSWVPLRLFWTTAGIVFGVLSLRVLWPARAIPQAWAGLASFLQALAQALEQLAGWLEDPGAGPDLAKVESDGAAQLEALRTQLVSLRGLLTAVQSELGDSARRHPQTRLMLTFMEASSTLLTVLDGLQRAAPAAGATGTLVALQHGEAQLVRAVADRLRLWAQHIARPGFDPLRSPLFPAWTAPPSWASLQPLLMDTTLSKHELPRLQRHALRLVFCGQADRALARTEALWHSLATPSRSLRRPQGAAGALL